MAFSTSFVHSQNEQAVEHCFFLHTNALLGLYRARSGSARTHLRFDNKTDGIYIQRNLVLMELRTSLWHHSMQ
ncbi:hypothetical protein NPIL_88171, partial [Nephila pilipes]